MSKVYNIVLIGAKSTGKTVYLTALYLLPFIRVTDKETLNYLRPLKEQFEKREISATNAGYQELFFEYSKEKFNLRFQIDDYDGKFAEQFSSDENKELKKKLENNIQKAEGMIFFLPYEKNLDSKKLDNIREEIDLFIEKVRELYPNKKCLPVPVVIAITKWDQSPCFKQKNEIEKAKEYIEHNEILKNIKEKIESFFDNVTIIPISSYEKYNLEKPLEFCFEKTFLAWEERIEEIKDNEFKLLCFLNSIKDDIKFYKNGKYLKLYEELESKIFKNIFEEIKKADTISKFNDIKDKFKLKNKNVIDCLTSQYKKEILKIEESLKEKYKKEKLKQGIIVGIIVIVIAIGYFIYNIKKNKNIIYSEIIASYKANNIPKALSLIQKYKKKYKEDDKNYKNVTKIENNIYAKCKDDIDSKTNNLNSLNSLSKKIEILQNIKKEANLCKINIPNFSDLTQLYENYQNLLKIIDSLSIENINENLASEIINLLTQIKNYDEYNTAYSLLNKKIETISEILLNSNNQDNIIDNISKLLNFISLLNIDNPSIINKLNQKYKILKAQIEFESFKDELNNLEYPQLIQYVKDNYKPSFSNQKFEIKQILQKRLNAYVLNIIDTAPSTINDENDLQALKQKIDIIENILNTTIDTIDYTPELSSYLKDKYTELKNLYNKYNKSATVMSEIFWAESKNNEPLGFNCNSIDEHDANIILNIGEHNYNYKEANLCNDESISWTKVDYYNEGIYNVKVVEKDILTPDDIYISSLELTKNDIINLINGKEVDKDIGNGYHIKLIGNE